MGVVLEWAWPRQSGCGFVEVGVTIQEWVWSCWSRCGLRVGVAFVGLGVAFLEKVCLWGAGAGALRLQKLKAVFPMPVDPEVEISATSPAPCLPACHHASYHDNNGLSSEL